MTTRAKTATKVSVVICTRDRPETIGQAVESVARCDYPAFDVHVMDQSTDDTTAKIVKSLATRHRDRCPIHYHHLERAGLSRAYNAGMRVSDGPVIACTDDDVIVPADWLTRIAERFDADPELGLLYGQVLVPPSLADAAAAGTIVVPSLTWTLRLRLSQEARNFKVWGMGANMALRRAILDRVAGFDEAMGGGAPLRSSQDFDFALRTYRAGLAVLLEPDVKVDHYGPRTPAQWPETERNYGIGDGAFYYKHIRCGDLMALRLFLRQLAWVAKRSVLDAVRSRRWVGVGTYGRNLVVGARAAARFDIDRERRLYRENVRARIATTDANSISGASADALRDNSASVNARS